MHKVSAAFRHRRSAMFLGSLAILAAAPLAGWGGLASAAATRAGGKVHVYEADARDDGPPGTIIVTGAITDHGTGMHSVPGHPNFGKLVLSKGSFEVNIGDPRHGLGEKLHSLPVDPKTCAAAGTVTAQVPIVKHTGTGAYRGIRGTFETTATEASIDPRLKNHQCNLSAKKFHGVLFGTGSGTVSYK